MFTFRVELHVQRYTSLIEKYEGRSLTEIMIVPGAELGQGCHFIIQTLFLVYSENKHYKYVDFN